MNFTYEPNFRGNYHAALYGFWGTRTRALRSARARKPGKYFRDAVAH